MKFPYDTSYVPPAPSIEIRLGLPGEQLQVRRAFVDSGADTTIVPLHYLRRLHSPVENSRFLASQWGERRLVTTHLVDVGIGEVRFPGAEVVADERGDETIIGRNLLNKLVLTLNGPRQTLDVDV